MLNIFEQPWTLLILAIVTLLAALVIPKLFERKRHWRQFAIPALLALTAFGADSFIQTDTEQISQVIGIAAKAVENENCDAIREIISDDYRDSHHNNKDSLLRYCKAEFSKPLVAKNVKRILAIDISSRNATVIFTMRLVFDKRSYVYQNFKMLMLIKIKADLQKEGNERWLVNQVEILEIDGQPAEWQFIQ